MCLTRDFAVGESGAVSSLETLLHDGPLTPEAGIAIIDQVETNCGSLVDRDVFESRRMALRAVGISSASVEEIVSDTLAEADEGIALLDLQDDRYPHEPVPK